MLQLQGRTSWRLRSNKGVIKRKIAELRMPSFAWDPFCSFWDSPIIALSLNGVPWVTLILFLKYVDFFKSNVPKDLGTCTVLHMFTQVLFWANFLPMLFIKLKHFFSKWPTQKYWDFQNHQFSKLAISWPFWKKMLHSHERQSKLILLATCLVCKEKKGPGSPLRSKMIMPMSSRKTFATNSLK